MSSSRSTEQKVILDLAFLCGAVGLGLLATHANTGNRNEGKPSMFLGLYILYLGVLFLISYFYSHASYVLKALMWICEHFSSPRGRYMAFFYFGLSLLLGGCALLSAMGLIRLR